MVELVHQVEVPEQYKDKHQHKNDSLQNNNYKLTKSPEPQEEHGLTANYPSLCNKMPNNQQQMEHMEKVLQ